MMITQLYFITHYLSTRSPYLCKRNKVKGFDKVPRGNVYNAAELYHAAPISLWCQTFVFDVKDLMGLLLIFYSLRTLFHFTFILINYTHNDIFYIPTYAIVALRKDGFIEVTGPVSILKT